MDLAFQASFKGFFNFSGSFKGSLKDRFGIIVNFPCC